jgi:hypothetical protein
LHSPCGLASRLVKLEIRRWTTFPPPHRPAFAAQRGLFLLGRLQAVSKRCETRLKKTLAFSEIALYNARLVIAAVKSGRDEGEEDDGWFTDYLRRQAVFCPSRIA